MAGGQKKKPPYATEAEMYNKWWNKYLTREEIDKHWQPSHAANVARQKMAKMKELNQNNLGNKKQFNDLNAQQKSLGNPKGLRDLEPKKKTKQSQSSVRNTLEKAFREKKR